NWRTNDPHHAEIAVDVAKWQGVLEILPDEVLFTNDWTQYLRLFLEEAQIAQEKMEDGLTP
ncbi:unnamed protein product, partial [Amoebophrya sp. A25]